jgi:hypothetical protein
VVHKNVTSANILLNDDLDPHLSGCGIQALVPDSKLEVRPKSTSKNSQKILEIFRLDSQKQVDQSLLSWLDTTISNGSLISAILCVSWFLDGGVLYP